MICYSSDLLKPFDLVGNYNNVTSSCMTHFMLIAEFFTSNVSSAAKHCKQAWYAHTNMPEYRQKRHF